MAFSSTGNGIEFNYPFKDILKKSDKYTDILDADGYKKSMSEFKSASKLGGDSLEKFKKQSADAKNGIADYAVSLGDATGSYEEYTKYVKEANEAQKKLTLGQKAASAAKSFGSSLLSNALNIGTGMLAGVAISGVISLIDSWVHRSENLIEAGKQAESEIQSLNQEYGNHKTTVESVIDSYDALRSKVDMKTNRNMGLTSTEYQQFLDQNNQLAEMFPTLVDGYDSQGNAIINLGSSAATASTQLNKLLETERKSNNYKIAEQAQTQYEGVAEQVKKLEEANIALEREAKNNESVSKQLSKNNIADSIGDGFYSIDAYSADGKKAYDALRKALRDNDVWYEANQIDDGKGGSEYRFTIGEMDAKTKADVIAQFESETHDLAWSYQDAANASFKQIKFNENEIAAKWAELRPTAEAMLETSPAFTEMDQTLQDGISSMLGNVDYSTIESKFGGDIEKFVREGMIAPIAMAGDQTQEAWKQLFALEGQREELTVEEWANRRDKLLNQITGGDKEQLKEISQNLGYLNSEGKGKVKQELDEMVGHLYDDIDSPEAKAFRENLKDLTGEDYEIALDLILNDDDHSIETIQDLRNEIADAKEELADEAFSFDNMTTALENAVEAQTKINQAVQNSNSSTGLLTEDVSNLATAFNEVAGYDTDVLLEKTASGLRLNRDALAAYQAEQEKNIKTNFEKSIQKQNEALVEQQKILNDASRTQDEKDVAQAEINTIQSQIEQLELMRAQYNGLTSDYAKWMSALSNGEEGDIYDTVATNWQSAKQAAEDGWIGTDEFKRAVDYMYSGSLDNQSAQEVKAVFDELNGLVSGWYQFDDDGNLLGMQSLKQFVSDAETLDDVLGRDVQTSFKKLEDGTYKATLNAQEFADAWGVSEEVITDLAGKMRDAGWDVDVTGVTSDFALMAETAEEAQEIVSNITGQTYEFDFKTTSLEKAREQLKQAEEQLGHFRNEDGSYNMDAEGASEAAQVYEYSARREQELSKPSISSVDTSSVAQSSQEFVEAAQNFQTAKDELDVQTQLAAQGLPNNLEQATADAQDSLSVLQDLQKAGKVPFDIDTSGLQEAEDGLQGLSDEEIKAKIGADTSQAQSDIQSLEGSSVTIQADVSTEGGAQDLASDFASLPEGIATTVTVDVQGEEQVENLTTAMESAPDNTPVTIRCNVENAEQLATINEQAAKLNEAGKNIKIDATIGEVDTSAIEGTEQNVDVKGQLTTVEGTEGQELTVDIKGNLTEISGAEGQELTVDVKGNLTEVSGGDGQTVNIDATANITNVTGAEGQQVNIDATVNPPDIPDVSGGTVEYDSVVEPPDVPDVEGGTVHYRSVVDPPTVPTASGVVNYTKGTVETANGQVSTGTINYNKGNVESADGTVSTGIINYDLGSVASADGTVSTGVINYALGSVAKPNGATATGVINYTLGSVARPVASGTMLSPARADGTAYNVLNYKNAYANGKVSLPKNETALVNELGGLMPSLNLSNAGISLEPYILQHSHEIWAGVNV